MDNRNDLILNLYPDSMGANLSGALDVIRQAALGELFSHWYLLPSLFRSDLDRGFSVIAYELDEAMATADDLAQLKASGTALKLDLVLNHVSAGSPEFSDVVARGDDSPWFEGFIDWNAFWAGHGERRDDGCIVPDADVFSEMFMRKPGLPVLRVPAPGGGYRFFWNTFYQEVRWEVPAAATVADRCNLPIETAEAAVAMLAGANESGVALEELPDHATTDAERAAVQLVEREYATYLGQVDLDSRTDRVWDYYRNALASVAREGARIVRLDAFAYLHKAVGRRNFFNQPETWELLDRVRSIADDHSMDVLPEIHSRYADGTHRELNSRGYMFYDFFLPVLVLHALDSGDFGPLAAWFDEIRENDYRLVTMLGCHDGIPVLDAQGLLPDHRIESLIDTVVARGGRVKNLYGPDGKKVSYYQVNATYFSAVGESPFAMVAARALQLFAPGIPQIWYLDLLLGTNDHARADALGHKEINRTNLDTADAVARLTQPGAQAQIALLALRRSSPAFASRATFDYSSPQAGVFMATWTAGEQSATLNLDLEAQRLVVSERSGVEVRTVLSIVGDELKPVR